MAAGTSGNVVATGGASLQVFSFANVGANGNVAGTNGASGSGNTGQSGVVTAKSQVVVDFDCIAATSVTNDTNLAGPPQNLVMLSRFVPGSGKISLGSWRSASGGAESPGYAYSGGTNWSSVILALKPTYAPLAIRLEQINARQSGESVDVFWRTGSEFDNLGFNVYRDDGQGRFRITGTPIIGAALLTGSGVSLVAGQRYSFRDILGVRGTSTVRYWLEDLDMNGTGTMHGPITPDYPDQALTEPPGAPAPTPPSPPAPLFATTFALAPAPFVLPEAPLGTPAVVADGQSADLQWQLAAGSGVKIGVNRTGWHQLTGADLVAAGLPWSTDPRRLSLFLEGREIPLEVRGGENGVLGDSDTIGFYGQAINANSTDTRVYWLTDQVGSHARLQPDAGGANPPGPGVTASAVSAVSEWRPRSLYFAALTNGEDDNFFGPLIAADPVSQHLTVPDRSSTAPVTVDVGVQGLSLTPHAVSVEMGGQAVGQIVLADHDRRSITLTVPESAITDNGFDVVFRASGDTDLTLVDFVRASYRRNAVAIAGQAQFVLEAGQAVSVGGFDPGDSVQVLDVTAPQAPRVISAGPADDAGQVLVAAASGAARSLLVRSQTQTMAPVFTTANQPSRLHENSNGGDLVVIGPGDLLSAFEPLKKLRESQGWLVKVVDVQDVYDEFSFGTRHPSAIRAFMARARQWATAPRALILLGDATFDPRDFLGKGAMDRVPTKLVDTAFMETASDDWFTDFDDDGIADVPVGRLPARTPADAVTMVSKLVDAPLWASAEEAANAVPALFVADSPDTENGYDFPALSREVSGVIAPPWQTVSFRRGEPGMDAAAFQALLQTRPAFIGYTGHGSEALWAGGLLGADLDTELGAGGPGAFWMDLTCLNGFFQDVYQSSLVEQLLLRPGAGAFGAWASSALTEADGQKVLGRAFVDQLLNRGAMLGEAAMRAKRLAVDSDIRRSWILFGDPTWRPAAFVAKAAGDADAGADAAVEPIARDADAAAEPIERDAGAVDSATVDVAAGPDSAGAAAKGDAGCACTTARSGGRAGGDASGAGAAFLLAICASRRRRVRGRLT